MTRSVGEILRAQKRRRRLAFWAGFVALLAAGALWAGLTKDPRGPGRFDEVILGAPTAGPVR